VFLDLVNRQWVYAFGVVKTIQPIEKNSDLFSDYRARFSMNDDVRIKKDSHRESLAAAILPERRYRVTKRYARLFPLEDDTFGVRSALKRGK
jgi:hypothetical protein